MSKVLEKLLQEADNLYQNKQYKKALETYDRFLFEHPKNPQALFGKSCVLNQLDQCLDALELLELVIDISGLQNNNIVDHKNVIIARVLAQDPSLDLGKSFEKAIEIRADSTEEGVQREYQFIAQVHDDYEILHQTLQNHDTLGVFDVLKVKIGEGEEIDYFFNINNFFGIEFVDDS